MLIVDSPNLYFENYFVTLGNKVDKGFAQKKLEFKNDQEK